MPVHTHYVLLLFVGSKDCTQLHVFPVDESIQTMVFVCTGHAPETPQMPEAEDMQPFVNEDAMPPADAIAADTDMPDHTANDIFMLEEEVEVER